MFTCFIQVLLVLRELSRAAYVLRVFGQATNGASYQGRLTYCAFLARPPMAWMLYFVQRDHVLTRHFYRLALSELDVVATVRAYTKYCLNTTPSDTNIRLMYCNACRQNTYSCTYKQQNKSH